MTEGQDSPGAHNADTLSLVRSVRRLTISVWCLTGLLAASYIVPWVIYFVQTRSPTHHTVSTASQATRAMTPVTSEFDNDFHARPPEEKIRRATVILVTSLTRGADSHKEVISEIIKHSPGVRFYYKVGDEFSLLSHIPTPECHDCEGEGQVVFLIGNPAEMASSYSYKGGRIEGMGGLSLAELRQLAQKPGRAVQ